MGILPNKKRVTVIYVFALITAYQIGMLIVSGNMVKPAVLFCFTLMIYVVWKKPLFGLLTYFFVHYFMPRQLELSEFISKSSIQMALLSVSLVIILVKLIMSPNRSTTVIQKTAIGTNKSIYLLFIFLVAFSSLDQMAAKILFKFGIGETSYSLLNLRSYFDCVNAVLIGIVSKLTLRKDKDLALLFKVIIAAGLIHALAGTVQYFWGVSFMQMLGLKTKATVLGGYSYTGRRLSSLLDTSPGSSSRFILLPFFLSAFFVFQSRRRLLGRSYYAVLVVIMLLSIFLTFSRGTLFAVTVFVCLISIFGLSKGRWLVAIGAALFAVILGFIFVDVFSERIAYDTRIYSSDNVYSRIVLLQAGLTLLKDNLVRGVGIGNSAYFAYKFALIPIFAGYSSLHNSFLEFVVNVGIGGILFLVLIIYKTIFSFYRSSRHVHTSWNNLDLFMIASYVGMLIPMFATTENILVDLFLFLTISEKVSQPEGFFPSDLGLKDARV